MAINRKIIWIVIGLIVILGSFGGLTVVSNITGNLITGGSVNAPEIEQEYFNINDKINNVGVNDGSHNSG